MADDVSPDQVPFLDLGISGVARYGGVSRVYEEFLKELQGPAGMKLYREQASNCPVTGAILYAAQHLARGTTARIDPANRKGANPRDALRIADRVSGALFNDLETTWPDTLSEILSMLTFGWSLMEVSWKRCQGMEPPRPESFGESLIPPPRPSGEGAPPPAFTPSKFDDGWMTWKSWGLRAQETLFMWEWDANSRATVMQQMAPPDFKVRRIPIKKCLHFRTQVAKQNPEGVSLLRHSVTSYLMKKNVQWVEGVGIERDLAGYPVFQVVAPDPTKRWVPPDIWNPNDANAVRVLSQLKTMARSVKRDDQEGMVLPWWIEFKLMGSGGSRKSSFDTNQIIERYEQRIMMSLLADFVMLGHDSVGSKALGEAKTELFTQALKSIMNIVASVINRFAIPELLRFNGIPQELAPTLVFGDVENVTLEELGGYVRDLAGAGMPLFPDGDLENYLRDAAKMPNTDPNGMIGDSSAEEEEVEPAEATPEMPAVAESEGMLAQEPEVAGAAAGEDVRASTLNGAQVTALLEILQSVATGAIPRETGVLTISTAFGLDNTVAEQLMGKLGAGFVPSDTVTTEAKRAARRVRIDKAARNYSRSKR